jgi:hypothetical protein
MLNNNERSLAHVEKIEWVRDIPGADRIVTYGILGWEIVDQKGKYNVGDKVIYCEIDSILPDKPEFEFLRDRKFRIKTIKLKGQVSQGLILPLSILPNNSIKYKNLVYGFDVTELLNITKYLSTSEKDECVNQEKTIHWTKKYKITKWLWKYKWFRNYIKPVNIKQYPNGISKTDEERLQNFPRVLEQFKDKIVYITEKVDYQSVTFTSKMNSRFRGVLGKLIPIKKFEFIVCSRNQVTNDKNNLYWKIAKKYNIEQILKENPTLTIQGEQGDTNIQGNKYGIKEPTMWVFNIIDHEKNYHYDFEDIKAFCVKYNLKCVPELRFNIKLSYLGLTVQELVEFSKGKSVLADIPREGVVIRCIENGKKILSFKVINPDFLLKYKL